MSRLVINDRDGHVDNARHEGWQYLSPIERMLGILTS